VELGTYKIDGRCGGIGLYEEGAVSNDAAQTGLRTVISQPYLLSPSIKRMVIITTAFETGAVIQA
jgi:hypothetical protein